MIFFVYSRHEIFNLYPSLFLSITAHSVFFPLFIETKVLFSASDLFFFFLKVYSSHGCWQSRPYIYLARLWMLVVFFFEDLDNMTDMQYMTARWARIGLKVNKLYYYQIVTFLLYTKRRMVSKTLNFTKAWEREALLVCQVSAFFAFSIFHLFH